GVLIGGARQIVEATKVLPERLQKERVDIESLESLEAMSDEGELSRNLYQKIVQADHRWKERQHVAEDWISEKPGTLRFHRELDGDGIRRYLTHPPDRKPKAENLPLIPW